jgi:serine/threonine protein kinase
MSLSIDKDLGEQGENARAVLASWLDDYISGRCDRADMQASFLSVCRSNPDAPWDALALLDQYQRRGRIDVALARSLKTDIAQLVFGVANQTESNQPDAPAENLDNTDATIDTTGSRWRKLIAERSPDSINSEPAFVDPTLFRREYDDPMTRPPPSLKPKESEPAPPRAQAFSPRPDAASVHAHSEFREPPVRPSSARPSSPAPTGPTSDVLRERYELISILGRGSTGTVYKAVDRHRAHLTPAARCVAVKVLKLNYKDRPDELGQLEREFHQAQSLSHPNVVSVFDLDRDGDVYFIVMELLEGELLADILKRLDGQPMARQFALGIISSVGAALSHAHRRDVVHADLKPRNIMITASGEVRVLDFGFARERPLELHSAPGLHDSPIAAPAYASVERVNGSEPHPSDDVYSLACVAYELLSGRHPFGGRSAPLARAHGRTPQRIPGLSGKQQQVLQRALMWTRGERRIDIVELLSGLGCGDAPGQLVPPEAISIPDAAGSRWRRTLVAACIAVLLAGGGYVAWQSGWQDKLANVFPITLPTADRELQSEAPSGPAVVNEQVPEEPVESPPVAAITPPQVAPVPSTQQAPSTQTQPQRQSPRQSSPPPSQQVELERSQPRQTQAPQRQASASDAQRQPSAPDAQKQDSAPGANSTPAPAAPSAAARGPVTIQFDKDTYVASEGDGSIRAVIRRTGSTRREVTFTWILRNNSAEAGSDYAGIGPGTETIPAGVREASITIPLVQDSIKETTELFLIELQVSEEGVSLGERSSAAVIIVDDD